MRHILLATTALVISGASLPAFAQAADDSATADIVVTAQKRTEKLQDIPVAASVVGTSILARANAGDITDLNKLVPSVQLKGTYNGRVPLGIRGVSTNANEGAVGLTSGVAIQIDGVPVPPDSFAANALDDVSQIEVLKGPQATLGGRTASAGVINIVTGGPTDILKGKFSASITDDNEQRVNFAVSGPVTEGIGFSLAGFDSHTTYLVHNIRTGSDARSTNYGVRGKLKFTAGDFDATLMGRISRFHSDGGTFTAQSIQPGGNLFPYIPSEFNGPGGSPSFFGIRNSVAFPGITIGYGNTNTATINDDMFATWKDKDASLVLNYSSGGLSFGSITAYQNEKQVYTQDVTLSSVYFFDILTGGHAPHFGNLQSLNETVKQFSQEFKISSDVNQPVSFLAGAFYSDNKVVVSNLRVFVGAPESFTTNSSTKTSSVYARVTGKITDSTSITGGVRYNHDKIAFQKTQRFDPANGAFQGCGIIGAFGPITCVLPRNSDSSNTLVGDVSISQKFGPNANVYASYTRGYKPKAFNTAEDFVGTPGGSVATLTQTPTGKERIDSFELGLKSRIRGLGTLNIAAFNTTYNNYQVQIFQALAGGSSILKLTNTAKARTQGVEADFSANLGENTHVTLAAAYINSKFVRFAGAPCYPDQTVALGCIGRVIGVSGVNGGVDGTQNLSGKSLPDSPKFKLNFDVEQKFPVGDTTDIVLGGNLSYRSAALFQANQNPNARQPGFALLNLSAGVDLDEGKYNLTLFVNNVTNKFYNTNMEDFFSGLFGNPGQGNFVIGQPARDAHRYFGGRFTAKF
jgi:iron complex outermembrane recepter protein